MARQPGWTDEATARLWDYYGELPSAEVPYFSRLLGDGVLNFAEHSGILQGEVLDYGSGPGYITHKLLDRGLSVTALDFSLRSCIKLRETVNAFPNFKGVHHVQDLPAPLPDSAFDLIICSEVVEHLPDSWLTSTVTELHRLVKLGGHVLVTTPHREILRQAFVYCPFCDSEFHRWQHQRSFCEKSLAEVLTNKGFELLFCGGIHLNRFQEHLPSLSPIRTLSVERLGDWIVYWVRRFLDRFTDPRVAGARAFRHLVGEGPHLVAIVTKTRKQHESRTSTFRSV
jgi:2-polyprenyl-3-methyl-5-hydroxy-6-metoxy-1,4-benzoquinol methylase